MNLALVYLANAIAAMCIAYGVHDKTQSRILATGAWLAALMALFYLTTIADAVAK